MHGLTMLAQSPIEAIGSATERETLPQALTSPPTVTGVDPRSGAAGDWVTIFGTNLFDAPDDVLRVTFSGVLAHNFAVDPASAGTRIKAAIPDAAVTGPISITRKRPDGGPDLLATGAFELIVRPVIRSVNPDPAIGGAPNATTVTLSGTGIGRDVSDRPEIRFHGVLVTSITALTGTAVSVTLPLNATDGPLTLKTRGGMTSIPEFNVILPPEIDSVVPNEGPVGTPIVITGRRFGTNGGNLRRISFEGADGPDGGRVEANKADPRNTNQMLFTTVPEGAVTGFIRVDRSKLGLQDPDGPGFSPTRFKVRADLKPPSNLAATPMGSVIALTWTDNSSDETSFVIERKDPNTRYTDIGRVGANVTNYTDNTALRNVTYTYRVRASNATGDSVASNEAMARLDGTSATTFLDFNPKMGLVGSIVSLTGTRLDAVSAVQFSASFGVVNAPLFLISPTLINTTVPPGTVSGPIVLRLNDGRRLQSPGDFRVAETMLNPPSDLRAVAASPSQVNLSWKDNSPNETGFKIERRTGTNAVYITLATVGANVTTYPDGGLVTNTTYTYRVSAVDQSRESAPSNEASVTLGSSAPTITGFTPASGAVGSLVTVSGRNVQNAFRFFFALNKTAEVVAFLSNSQVQLRVPAGAVTGPIGVSGVGGDGFSGQDFVVEASGDLAAPTNLTGSAVSSTQIDLAWTDNSGNEEGFIVERGSGLGTAFAQIVSVPANTRRYADPTVSAGTLYTYRVKAFNASRQSVYSNTVRVGTPQPSFEFAPNAPSALVASVSGTTVNLRWVDNSNVESGFSLERKVGLNGTYSPYANLGPNSTSFADTATSAGTTYSYRILAFNQNGLSAFSNEASVTVQSGDGGGGGGTVPLAPSNLTATGEIFAVTLSWTDNSMNEGGFKIERRIGTGDWTPLTELPANTRGYTDSPLSPFNVYTYRVRAFNATGHSDFSNEASARPTRLILGA